MDFYDIINEDMLIDSISVVETQRRRKIYKQRINPLNLPEDQFKTKYRFTKEYVNFIVELIKNDIKKDSRGGGISPELQVLTALRTWARNEIQDDCADLHGLSQRSITNVCQRVARALARRSSEFIKMPVSQDEQSTVMMRFRRIAGLRNIIGAIDCTHVRIKKIGGDSSQYYINRKGFYSLNVQVVCDADLYIRDIVAHWRGSTHDARIFRESRIKERFEANEFSGKLLGDSGYACTPYLFTPILRQETTEREDLYNKAHISTRNTVERCFGVWKQRFRCLLNGVNYKLTNTKMYIVALAVLHNIALNMNENIEVEPMHLATGDIPSSRQTNNTQNDEVRGNAARAAYIMEHF